MCLITRLALCHTSHSQTLAYIKISWDTHSECGCWGFTPRESGVIAGGAQKSSGDSDTGGQWITLREVPYQSVPPPV